MDDSFRIRYLTEEDIDGIVAKAGGKRAHPDFDRRDKPGADYVLGDAIIELKKLDEEGIDKANRQAKLAAIFRKYEGEPPPVVVIDRERLPAQGQSEFNRILEGPIKKASDSARKQLNQSRIEYANTRASILWIVNNGYTALDHNSLVEMIAHRVRNDTTSIDGIVVSGGYFYTDSFDFIALWPMEYVPINLGYDFAAQDQLREAWQGFAEFFMTQLVLGGLADGALRAPVVDTEFVIDEVTYVKPAPPMGMPSQFFAHGRPRKNFVGFDNCPAVGLTFADMNKREWGKFKTGFPGSYELFDSYEAWAKDRTTAFESGTPLRPFVPMNIVFDEWLEWARENDEDIYDFYSVRRYANELFGNSVRERIASARQRSASSVLPARYVLAITEEIGQNCGNDISHIYKIKERVDGEGEARPLAENLRISRQHALLLAGSYAVVEGIECVLWEKDLRYAWDR